jgi:hypothetical protein
LGDIDSFFLFLGVIMSVLVSGVLKITARNGRNGVFNVGELCTDLAVFKIKQAILEQFEEGEYPGEFMIAQIFQSSFIHKGRAFTDICANLVGLDIFAANLAVPKPLDPMDEQEEAAIQGSVAQEPILERPIVLLITRLRRSYQLKTAMKFLWLVHSML